MSGEHRLDSKVELFSFGDESKVSEVGRLQDPMLRLVPQQELAFLLEPVINRFIDPALPAADWHI